MHRISPEPPKPEACMVMRRTVAMPKETDVKSSIRAHLGLYGIVLPGHQIYRMHHSNETLGRPG